MLEDVRHAQPKILWLANFSSSIQDCKASRMEVETAPLTEPFASYILSMIADTYC
jgi:hypothetical protein